MTTIFKGSFLTIKHNTLKTTFYQSWHNVKNLTIEAFKKEMLVYTELYASKKPSFTIWDQTNFPLLLDKNDFEWIEENVNIPCLAFGNQKCAFVVGQDVLAHISVMDSFNEVQSCIQPQHFGSISDAEKWLKSKQTIEKNDIIVEFEGVNNDGENIFKITSLSKNVENTLKVIKRYINNQDFFKRNKELFYSLTKKEREILLNFGQGKALKEIAYDSNTSIHTVRTHWKNIKRKLSINSTKEALHFFDVFMK